MTHYKLDDNDNRSAARIMGFHVQKMAESYRGRIKSKKTFQWQGYPALESIVEGKSKDDRRMAAKSRWCVRGRHVYEITVQVKGDGEFEHVDAFFKSFKFLK